MPTPTTQELLDFEAQWTKHTGWKEEAIRSRFAVPPARFYQLLGRAIDTLEAEAIDPMLVHRLRRRRDAARESRQRRTCVV